MVGSATNAFPRLLICLWFLLFLTIREAVALCGISKLHNHTFFMYSIFTHSYKATYSEYTEKKVEYAKHHGYPFTYDIDYFNIANVSSIHSTALRLYAARNLILGLTKYSGPPLEWIVYLDADAFVIEKQVPLSLVTTITDSIIQEHSKKAMNLSNCSFIAQDDAVTINSGFWLLRNSTKGLAFLDRWIEIFDFKVRYIGLHVWMHDQGALCNAILQVASEFRKAPKKYEYDCYYAGKNITDLYVRTVENNKCFGRTLTSLKYPTNSRFIDDICLVPSSLGTPYLFHKQYSCVVGEMICHKKKLPVYILNRQPFLKYNISHPDSELGLFNGTLIKPQGFKHHAIYFYSQREHELRRVPNLDSVYYYGNVTGRRGIVELSQTCVKSMKQGALLEIHKWP